MGLFKSSFNWVRAFPLLVIPLLAAVPWAEARTDAQERFNELEAAPWKEVFFDSGIGDWQKYWFLDGMRGEARNTPEGLFLSAGPVEEDHASHVVLWTQESFRGDIKLEFEFIRLDTVNRGVNIIYLLASGIGNPPFVEDISQWSSLRTVPYMKTYFNHMQLLHISFSAYPMEDTPEEASYIRARRYPRSLFGSFAGMEIEPDFENTGLFKTGVPYQVTVIKAGNRLFMRVKSEDTDDLFCWNLEDLPDLQEGRVGFRLMWQRASLFRNIRISELPRSN